LLRELKERGYKIVHVVQASAEEPKTATAPEQWAVMRTEPAGLWPRAEIAVHPMPEPVLAAPSMGNFGIADPADPAAPVALSRRSLELTAAPTADPLPAPDASNFRYWHLGAKPRRAVRILRRPGKKEAPTASHSSAPPSAAAAKDATGSISGGSRSTAPAAVPRPPRPVGHQLQLPKPTAGLQDRVAQ